MDNNSDFELCVYLDKIKNNIYEILSRPTREILTFDMLDTEFSKKHKLIALKEKQRRMKYGEIWQMVLGNYDTFTDLHIGHKSGLDIISIQRKIIIELKNRTNTDNSSSKKSNLDKLSYFKKNNPDYICIYGCINDITEKNTTMGKNKTIIHNCVELKQYVGNELLTLILGKNTQLIINFVKETIERIPL
jgi:hypothetical protein